MTAAARVWVAGAGPAGAVAARAAARAGATVTLFDRAVFPRAKVCGCCLNLAAVAALESVGLGDLPAKLGAVPLSRVRVACGRAGATIRLPGGFALSRTALDGALIAEAVAAGADFRPGTGVTPTERAVGTPGSLLQPRRLFVGRADRVNGRVKLADRRNPTVDTVGSPDVVVSESCSDAVTVRATGLTGCDGPPIPGSRLGAGTVLPADRVPAFFAPGTIFMAVGRGGYVGLVRLEDDALDLAAAFDPWFVKDVGGLGNAAEAVLKSSRWPEVPGVADLTWRGTPLLTRRAVQVAGDRWLAAGDAAGYVEPFTGEGMAWAVATGAAAGTLAAKPWNPSRPAEWAAAHAALVAGRQRACRLMARGLRHPTLTKLAVRLVARLPGLARQVVSALNRPARLPPIGCP